MQLNELLFEVERLSTQLPGEPGLMSGGEYRTKLLNRGQRDFVFQTRFLKDKYQFDAIVGQRTYDFKEMFPLLMDLDAEGGVYYDGELITEVSFARKNRDDGDWKKDVKGTSREYLFRDKRYFEPHPIADDTLVFELNALVWPNELFDYEDEPFNGHHAYQEFHWAPIYFALKELMKNDDKQQARYELAYRQELSKALRLPTKQNNMSTKVLPPMVYNSMRGRRR